MAAALPGVIASHARLCPVIGVALPSEEFKDGLDAMLSIARLPKGIPVAFAGIGKAGLVNAALLVCQILAMSEVVTRRQLFTVLGSLDKTPQIGVFKTPEPTPKPVPVKGE